MKHSVLAAGLAVLVAAASAGCKSTPKLAFWKSDKNAEAATLAHSAPELPSEAAKQNEAAKAGAAQMAGGTAPAYKPGATTASATSEYPNTTAPAFGATTNTQVASTSSPSSANLGSIGLPYDPTAVPAPKTASTATNAYASAERYSPTSADSASGASTTAPSYTSSLAYGAGASAASTPDSTTPSSSIYGRYTPSPSDIATAPANAAATTASSVASSAASDANSYANQQAMAAAAAYPGMPGATTSPADAMAAAITPYNSQPASSTVAAASASATGSATTASATSPATTVAAIQPYRPGGTSTYPSTGHAAFQVATRPSDSNSATPSTDATAPAAGVSAPTTTPGAQPSTRYW